MSISIFVSKNILVPFKHGMACLMLLMLPVLSFGNTITGFVKDSISQPVDVATVSLIRLPDSVFIKAELTDPEGKFSFYEVPDGT